MNIYIIIGFIILAIWFGLAQWFAGWRGFLCALLTMIVTNLINQRKNEHLLVSTNKIIATQDELIIQLIARLEQAGIKFLNKQE